MARMIPSIISPEIKSNAERKIFEWFRDDPRTNGWIVLHSLGIANHKTVLYGELDFFVIAPKLGVFALEVKGGRVSCNNGLWSFTNKYNQTNTKKRGPFAQASEGMFSLMDSIEKKLGKSHKLSNILYAYGVMFPDIEFNVEGPEGEQWQIFDSRNGKDVYSFIHRLSNNTKRKWEEKYGSFPVDKLPNTSDVKELADLLRGDIDRVVTLGKKISYTEDAFLSLTKEQFRCLDQLEDNSRCLIRGAAGTGKTLLAIETVKKSVVSGEKVAFFCFNNMLASWLKKYFENEIEEVKPYYVGTIHSWMMNIVKKNGNKVYNQEFDQEFYQNELPILALEALEKEAILYDKIVIDEAQDILGTDSFEVLDCVLKNGIERGKWTLFGDFSHQAIFLNQNPEAVIHGLEEKTSFIKFKLNINCRNTKKIGDEIHNITGFDNAAYLWSKIEGVPVEHMTYNDGEQETILRSVIDKLINEGIKPNNITILSPYKRENSIISAFSNKEVVDYKPDNYNNIQFSTIHAYKGLENSVIILVDIDSFSHEQLMYVGLSRARSGLIIIESLNGRKDYMNIMKRRIIENG